MSHVQSRGPVELLARAALTLWRIVDDTIAVIVDFVIRKVVGTRIHQGRIVRTMLSRAIAAVPITEAVSILVLVGPLVGHPITIIVDAIDLTAFALR
tara:strand:+ start:1342 stop:1632 length:291 start_codon:yes stop_codon:yes gene_type:complete